MHQSMMKNFKKKEKEIESKFLRNAMKMHLHPEKISEAKQEKQQLLRQYFHLH